MNTKLPQQESQKTLEALFQEKKKVKQMEQQLLMMHKETALIKEQIKKGQSAAPVSDDMEDEVESLRVQQKQLKDLYYNLQQEVEEWEGKYSAVAAELKQERAQSQKTDQNQEASEGLELKLQAVQSRLADTTKRLEEAVEQDRRSKQRLEKLTATLHEKERKLLELDQLESLFRKNSAKAAEYETELEGEKTNLRTVRSENEKLKQIAEEAQQHNRQMERVIQFLRERSEEAQLESKQLNTEYQGSQDIISQLKEEVQSAKNEWQDLSAHFSKEQHARQEAVEQLQQFKKEVEAQKRQVTEQENAIVQKDRLIQELQQQNQQLREEKRRLEQQANRSEGYEQQLKESISGKEEARKRSQHLEEEVALLSGQLRSLKDKWELAKAQQETIRYEAEQMKQQFSSAQGRCQALETEKHDLLDKNEKQKRALNDLKTSLAAREKAHQDDMVSTKQEVATLTAALGEFQTRIENVYKERESLQVALKHHQEELQRATERQADAQTKSEQLSSALQMLQESSHTRESTIEELRQKLSGYMQNNSALEEETAKARRKVEELENRLQTYNEGTAQKERAAEEVRARLSTVLQEKTVIENDLSHTRRRAEENDAKAQIAHQHLAKKVKEAALLSEKLEQQKVHLQDLQKALALAQNRMAETQGAIDNLQREKVQGDAQLRKWEENYFHMHEQWQQAEAVNADLRKQKEKLDQLQALLSNMGSVIGTSAPAVPVAAAPLAAPSPLYAAPHTPPRALSPERMAPAAPIEEAASLVPPTQPAAQEPYPHFEHEEVQSSQQHEAKQYQNLFDLYKQQPKAPKRNLFDE